MSLSFHRLLSYISYCFHFLPMGFAIAYYRNCYSYLKIAVLITTAALVAESLLFYTSINRINNLYIVEIYTVIEFWIMVIILFYFFR